MREIEVATIEEYLKLIKSCKQENIAQGNSQEFLFRGQLLDHPLLPKICRLKAKGELSTIERQVLHEFKRTNPLLIREHQPLDDWDYLALGQHFGLPTRLLDWSFNALTALWFATGSADSEKESVAPYSVVWMLMPEEQDFELDIDTLSPFDVSETRIVRPRIIKQRIHNQSGVFSILSTREMLEGRYMNETEAFQQKLLKIKVPRESFDDIRSDMHTLGVNAFTIFPELEGLCSYLQWRYFN